MRKGKGYEYILPPILAPDVPAYQGWPKWTDGYANILVAGNYLSAGVYSDCLGYERDLPRGMVGWTFDCSSGLYRWGVRVRSYLSPTGLGVRIAIHIELMEGSFWDVEKDIFTENWWTWPNFPYQLWLPPWSREGGLGIVTGVAECSIRALSYKDAPHG